MNSQNSFKHKVVIGTGTQGFNSDVYDTINLNITDLVFINDKINLHVFIKYDKKYLYQHHPCERTATTNCLLDWEVCLFGSKE